MAQPSWQWVRVQEAQGAGPPHSSLLCPPQWWAICGGRTRSYLSKLAPSGWPGGEPGNARVAAKSKSLCPGLPFPKRGCVGGVRQEVWEAGELWGSLQGLRPE